MLSIETELTIKNSQAERNNVSSLKPASGAKNSIKPQVCLKPEYINALCRIFDSYCPKSEIWAYGSRVYGDNHVGSDLDLVVMIFEPTKRISELKKLISNSDLPFLVDITEYNSLPLSFQKEIREKGIVFYSGKYD